MNSLIRNLVQVSNNKKQRFEKILSFTNFKINEQ